MSLVLGAFMWTMVGAWLTVGEFLGASVFPSGVAGSSAVVADTWSWYRWAQIGCVKGHNERSYSLLLCEDSGPNNY